MSETKIQWNDGKSTMTLHADVGSAINQAWHSMLHHGYGIVVITEDGAHNLPLHQYLPEPPNIRRKSDE